MDIKYYDELLTSDAFRLIKKDYDSGRLSHSYMIVADDRDVIDSFMVMVELLIYCDKGMCGSCTECRKILEHNNTNVYNVVANDGKAIKVEEITAMIDNTYMIPFENNYMIYTINRGETMTVLAENKLLKTLEEPQGKTLILIGTTNEYNMLETIKSRCKKLYIERFTKEQVISIFKDRYSPLDIDRAYDMAGGIISKVENMLSASGNIIDEYNKVIDMLACLKSSRDVPKVADMIKNADSEKVRKFVDILEIIMKDILKNPDKETGLTGFNRLSVVNIQSLIDTAREKLYFNCRPQAVLDYLLLGILEVKYKCR